MACTGFDGAIGIGAQIAATNTAFASYTALSTQHVTLMLLSPLTKQSYQTERLSSKTTFQPVSMSR